MVEMMDRDTYSSKLQTEIIESEPKFHDWSHAPILTILSLHSKYASFDIFLGCIRADSSIRLFDIKVKSSRRAPLMTKPPGTTKSKNP